MDPTASFPIFSDSLLLAVASALASDSKQANYAIGRGSGEESDQLQVASLVGDSRVVVAADALYATAKPRSRDVGFRVSGSWQFSASRGVIIEAVTMALTPDGDIAVPVPGDGAVRVYHPDGTLRAELTGMMAPAGVAVTNQGDLFVTESRVGSFRRYDATANGFELSDRSLGQGQLEFPTGIAIDERTGHIFIGDKSLKRVVEFDSEGVFIRELVEMANPPSVIAWSPKIGLIASDGAGLVRLQPGGGVYEKVQVTGGTVAGLGVNVDGGVLVSVLEGRVYLLDESGRLSGPLATDSDIGVPFSLASRVRDVIFVYDMLGFRILRLERSANDHR
jgi:sugar lactone lactonase YvrE